MELNFVAVQLALLFVPGLLWAMVDAAHRPRSQSDQFVYILRAFVFGVITYTLVGLGYRFTGSSFDIVNFSAQGWRLDAAVDELLWAVVTSLILSVLWLYGRTYKLVTRLFHLIRATNYIADPDIWSYIFNAREPSLKYVHIRDYEHELIYAGYVVAFSERLDLREIALVDVKVYTADSEEIYSVPYLYLARSITDITLEFPVLETANVGES